MYRLPPRVLVEKQRFESGGGGGVIVKAFSSAYVNSVE